MIFPMAKHNLLITSLLLLIGLTTHAVPRSSVSLGSGGGGVASVEPGESSFMNPATLVHLKGRHFFSTFQKDLTAVSITENTRGTVLPGALTYANNSENDINSQAFGLTFSEYVGLGISVGLGINYWQAEIEGDDKRRSTAFNGLAGLAWTPHRSLGFAIASENIITPDKKFRQAGLLEPATRFGMNYTFREWFRTRLDFVTLENNNFDKLVPQAGMETYLGKWFILRAGWSKPPGLRESWSGGLGVDLPRFRIDYASRWNVDGSKESRHSVDLGVPF